MGLPALTWSMSGTGYQFEIQIDTASTFPHPLQDTVVPTDQTTYTASVLPAGSYYWRVRAINGQGVGGAWSASRTFTLTSAPPPAPVLLSPVQGASVNTLTPTFSWQTVSGAKTYTLQLTLPTDTSFSSPFINHTGITIGTYTLSAAEAANLHFGSLYNWRVLAVNVAGDSTPSAATFQVAITLHKTPANGSSTMTMQPTFAWQTVSGAKYRLQVTTSADASFAAPIVDTGNTLLTTTTYTIPTSLPPQNYLWRVWLSTTSTWMPAWSFEVTSAIPTAPVLTYPANHSLINDNTPTFTWQAGNNSANQTYEIQVDKNSTFPNPLPDATTAMGILSETSSTLPDGTYYWRVRAISSTGAVGSWATTASFTIDSVPPAVPVLTYPGNGAAVTNPKLALNWSAAAGAATYQVQIDHATLGWNLLLAGAGTGRCWKRECLEPRAQLQYRRRVEQGTQNPDYHDSDPNGHSDTICED
jgi:predicted phage tail protein